MRITVFLQRDAWVRGSASHVLISRGWVSPILLQWVLLPYIICRSHFALSLVSLSLLFSSERADLTINANALKPNTLSSHSMLILGASLTDIS